MDKLFIILLMLFLHIADDYYLQGILASMKQRSWWKENAPDMKYKNDYIVALVMHGFSWTFMVMLPVAAYMDFSLCVDFYIWFFTNWVIHSTIDHMKANVRSINLVQDQTAHIAQIVVTAVHFLYS
jgi:hypothetical protein